MQKIKKNGEKTKEKFYLEGVISYLNDDYGNENYIAYVKVGKNGEWYCYSDENVYPITFQDILTNGYPVALFYQKLVQK